MKRNLATAALLLAALVMANVVAAGVMVVIAQAAEPIADEQDRLWVIAVSGALGVASALLFLRGCLTAALEHLQCLPARRGG
jgi:hypothetical protein